MILISVFIYNCKVLILCPTSLYRPNALPTMPRLTGAYAAEEKYDRPEIFFLQRRPLEQLTYKHLQPDNFVFFSKKKRMGLEGNCIIFDQKKMTDSD